MKKNALVLLSFFFLTFFTALFIFASEAPCDEYSSCYDHITTNNTEVLLERLDKYITCTDEVVALLDDEKIQLEYFDDYVTCNDDVIKSDTEILLEYLSSIPFNLPCTERYCVFDNGGLTVTITRMISSGLRGSSFYVANFGYIYPPSNFIEYIELHGFPVPQIYSNSIFIWTASEYTCYLCTDKLYFNTSELPVYQGDGPYGTYG